MTYHLRCLDKKFVRCSIRVLVSHLRTIITQNLDVPPDLKVYSNALSLQKEV